MKIERSATLAADCIMAMRHGEILWVWWNAIFATVFICMVGEQLWQLRDGQADTTIGANKLDTSR